MFNRNLTFVKKAAFSLAVAALGAMLSAAACEPKRSPTFNVGFNFHLVSQGEDSQEFRLRVDRMLEIMKRIFKNAKFEIDSVEYFVHTGPDAERLTHVDIYLDEDGTGWPDQMEELLTWSSRAPNKNIDIFLVRSVGNDFLILGAAGDIPGPAQKGTPRSGILLNTFGDFFAMTNSELALQASTLVHEAGHYLGLWHTTERNGLEFDLLRDTPECPSWTYDFDHDGVVSPIECYNLDGQFLMFWAAGTYAQEDLSGDQIAVMKNHPWVREK